MLTTTAVSSSRMPSASWECFSSVRGKSRRRADHPRPAASTRGKMPSGAGRTPGAPDSPSALRIDRKAPHEKVGLLAEDAERHARFNHEERGAGDEARDAEHPG